MEWVCAGFIVLAGCCYDSAWFFPLCALALGVACLV